MFKERAIWMLPQTPMALIISTAQHEILVSFLERRLLLRHPIRSLRNKPFFAN